MIWMATKHKPSHIAVDDVVGFIPTFLSEQLDKPARKQLDENYQHGGGWRPIDGFKMDMGDHSIKYPGDPRLYPWVWTQMRDETIYMYQAGIIAIVQKDGSYEIARMD